MPQIPAFVVLRANSVGSASVLSAGVSDSVVVSVRNKLSSALTVWLSETDPSHQHRATPHTRTTSYPLQRR